MTTAERIAAALALLLWKRRGHPFAPDTPPAAAPEEAAHE